MCDVAPSSALSENFPALKDLRREENIGRLRTFAETFPHSEAAPECGHTNAAGRGSSPHLGL